MILPQTIIHADWGTNPRKRWQVRSELQVDGRYLIDAPQPVADTADWLLHLPSTDGPALVGFDFPIGLPLAYADQVGITDFATVLPQLGSGTWANFYQVANVPAEIGLRRPFYPYRPGGTRQQYLLDALDVASIDELRRVCERRTISRGPAAPLFWTMGAQQVGKAAISGWREVLVPALRDLSSVVLWPFAGALEDLMRPGRLVIAETYPAEVYQHLGLTFSVGPDGKHGKRRTASRAANMGRFMAWADQRPVVFTTALRETIASGFGNKPDGEDRFDALVGLLGMVNVALGNRPPGEPDDTRVRRIEGWILGQVTVPVTGEG